MGIIFRIYAAECGTIVVFTLAHSPFATPAFMGFFTTAILSIIGWFSKNTDKSYRYSETA